ncbi:MAG TPA: hypothetical protein VF581_04245 [Flavobacterium sp.]|jgi:hypothetical protein
MARKNRSGKYFKAFEITKDQPLSSERLVQASKMYIKNSTDSIKEFKQDGTFTIYEGDWGKPYAARFEIWFKPKHEGRARKLIEKNYKIEGWQR